MPGPPGPPPLLCILPLDCKEPSSLTQLPSEAVSLVLCHSDSDLSPESRVVPDPALRYSYETSFAVGCSLNTLHHYPKHLSMVLQVEHSTLSPHG